MKKTTDSQSFANKAQKNVKFMFNFLTSFVEEFKIIDQDPTIKSFVEMFEIMMNKYKELCIEIAIEKLNYFNGSFVSETISEMFNKFLNKPEQT